MLVHDRQHRRYDSIKYFNPLLISRRKEFTALPQGEIIAPRIAPSCHRQYMHATECKGLATV